MSGPGPDYDVCNKLGGWSQTACLGQLQSMSECVARATAKETNSAPCIAGVLVGTQQYWLAQGNVTFDQQNQYCNTMLGNDPDKLIGCQIFAAETNFPGKQK